MGTLLAILPLLSLAQTDVETRTLRTGPQGGADTNYIHSERIVSGNSILLVSKTISAKGDISYSTQTYASDGTPVHTRQEGFWNDKWNVFETSYGAKEAVQTINGEVTRGKQEAKRYRNSAVLWFWKKHPKVGESVTVDFLAQNTIATFQIKFTYEGDETMKLAGRDATVHRVREDPLSAKGVYTIWWYDDKGMGVKRYHKTTQHEYTFDLLAWR